MNRVKIDRIIKCSPHTNPKTRRTVYELQVEGTVDGRDIGTIAVKTWIKGNADGLAEGMDLECEAGEYPKGSGHMSYLLPKVLPAGTAPARPKEEPIIFHGPQFTTKPAYTRVELIALAITAEGVASTTSEAMGVAWFNKAVELGIKSDDTAETEPEEILGEEPDGQYEQAEE